MRDELQRALRQAGLRVTEPRLAVLGELFRARDHYTAEGLAAALAETGKTVSRATAYNALRDLADAGLVSRVETGHGRARFEAHRGAHQHFVCTQCGALEDLPGDFTRSTLRLAAKALPGRPIESVDTLVRGRCAQCAATREFPSPA